MSLDQGLLEAAYGNLRESISEYNGRYGYLGADWERDVEARYNAHERVSFRVYFEGDYCYDAYFEDGEWHPDTYLQAVAEQALEFAIEHGDIDDPLPRYIEITF